MAKFRLLKISPLPASEGRRLEALRLLRILDTQNEQDFDDLVKLASDICETPISLISLIDEDRQWFKAKVGLNLSETSRNVSFCAHAIHSNDVLQIPDATKDDRFVDNPLVIGAPKIRFYAGAPLTTKDGLNLGTICVIDDQPKQLSVTQLSNLRIISKQIVKLFELRLKMRELEDLNHGLRNQDYQIRNNLDQISKLKAFSEKRERQYRELIEGVGDMIYELDASGQFVYVNPAMEFTSEYSKEELLAKKYWHLVTPDVSGKLLDFYNVQITTKQDSTYFEFPMITKSGREVWVGQRVNMQYEGELVYRVSVVARDITEIHKSKLALQQSEQRFKSLADNAPVAIFESNKENKIVYANNRWTEIFGLTPDEFSKDGSLTHVASEDKEKIAFARSEILKNHQPFSIEYRIINPEKGLRWVMSTGTPISDVKGKFSGYIGTVVDLTDRKIAEEKLVQSEQLHRLLSENQQDIIAVFNTDNKFQYISPSVKNILGYDPSELIGKIGMELVHPDDIIKLQEPHEIAKQGIKIVNPQFRLKRKDGTYVWIEAHSNPILNSKGETVGIQTVNRDISERKAAEDALFESERRYKLVSENSRDFIALHQPDGTYTYVSPSVIDLLGYDEGELIGRLGFDLIHPEDLSSVVESAKEDALLGRVVSATQFRMRRKDGEFIWVEAYTKPIIEDGKVTAVQTSARDISLRKRYELDLLESKEKAEEATKAKSLFLSMMSHEIRTPLNAIIGLTNLLLVEDPRDDQRESLKLLKFSGENLLTIINDILDFSKIEANKLSLESVDINLEELLENTCNMLRQRAQEKGILLQLEHDANIARYLKGDSVRLMQIFINLLGNAVKFTEQGYVKLSTRLKEKQSDMQRIEFQVEDTGIGIENEKLEAIFESFSQAATDTTRKFGGTGLGLSITKRLLDLMGSTINVKSQPGKGTLFSFALTLPIGESASQLMHAGKDYSDKFKNTSVKILVVDDNRVNQIVAGNWLKKWNITVELADDGYQAIEKMKDKSVHLVLMDLQMPGMDGYESTKRIRAIKNEPYFKTVPIIALSASAMLEIKDKALESGMTDFISKPFQPNELQAIIGKYLFSIKPSIMLNGFAGDVLANADPDFRRELMSLLLKSMTELSQSFNSALRSRDTKAFLSSVHKSKTAIKILGDAEFLAYVDLVALALQEPDGNFPDSQAQKFNELCQRIIDGLTDEVSVM